MATNNTLSVSDGTAERKASAGGNRFSRPRIITLASMALALLLMVALFVLGGSFSAEVYVYTENTKVLLYHLVAEETYGPNEYLFVRPEDFERQLAEIQRTGLPTVFADELDKTKREPCVVLTFDDGYVDNYTTVLPLLEKYDMKATVFLISDVIGTPGHLSEEQIRKMAASGRFHFGSHTKTHPVMTEVSEDVLKEELSESRRRIEALTGREVTALAYPNGVSSRTVELAAADCGYRFCYTTDRPSEAYYENTKLPRSYVVRDMAAEDFLNILK